MLLSPAAAYLLDLLAKFMTTASYLIMKLAHHQLENNPDNEGVGNVKVYCTCTMFLGLVTAFGGGVLDVLMLPFCDLVLLATTVGLSILFSNLLAMKFLGERMVWKYDVVAFLFVVAGCTAIVLLSEVPEEDYTPERIKQLLSSPYAIGYLIFAFLLLILALVSVKFLVRSTKQF